MKKLLLLVPLLLIGCAQHALEPVFTIEYHRNWSGETITYTYSGGDTIHVEYSPFPSPADSTTKNPRDQIFAADARILEKDKKSIDDTLRLINPDKYATEYSIDEMLDANWEVFIFYKNGRPNKRIKVYCQGVENLWLLSGLVDDAIPSRYRSGYAQFLAEFLDRQGGNWRESIVNPDQY